MKGIVCSMLLLWGIILNIHAQEKMDYFLPVDGITYNPEIPTPEAYFQQQMGEWHLNYEQILSYMNEIARISDRAIIRQYARTYENRPLLHVIFT